MSEKDPFTGKWEFRAERSTMNAPGVRSWVQWIEARFDGKEYPVRGSSMVDAIAYTRLDRCNISGMGKKNGNVTLRETITAEPDGRALTLTFAIFSEEREVANGVAVFQKEVTSG